MHKRLKLVQLFLFSVVLFFGCSKDEGLTPEQMRYGRQDTISLGFAFRNAGEGQVQVKAPVNVSETVVNNVNVYVFNEQGDVISHRYAVGGASLSGMVIYRNMRYRVYAVANAGESLTCRTVAEVEGIVRSIGDIFQVADAAGGVLMSGKTDLLLLTDGQQIPVDLERCVSKFLLKCDYSQLNPGVTITVKRVQLKNAPKQIRLFGSSKASVGAVIDGEVRTGSDLNSLSGSGAAFYLFENMQGVIAPAALDNKTKEQQMSADAKVNSSYIEMEYDYLSPEKSGTIVYRFYLGKTFADCDVKRNTQYNCTVLFKGNGSAGENSWSVDNSRLVDRVTGITLNPASHTFKALGEVLNIRATVLPATADNAVLSWVSSNPAIAKVDASGAVTAVADGSCTITATSTDGTNVSASCAILVDSKVLVTSVSVTPITLTLFTGETGQLTATVLPANATVPGVAWGSSNTSVARVDMTGKVTAVATGTADITGMSVDDNTKKAVCRVTVQNKELTIDPLSKTLYVGERFAIHYTVKPPVLPSFTSSATGVAAVDANGNVTGLAAGTANITVSAHGLTAICAVTVVQPEIAFPYASKVMYDGEEVLIPYSKLVPNTAVPTVTSSATGTVEILESSSTGVKVKALAAGSATITATVGSVSAMCTIDVQQLRVVFTDPGPLAFYQGFDDLVNYTIYPEHARNLSLTWSSSAPANLVHISENTFQGQNANTTASISATFDAFPTKIFTIQAQIKPAISITETEIDLAANSGVSRIDNTRFPGIYVSYALTIDKHPRAVVNWSGTMVGNDMRTVNVSPDGILSTSVVTDANGTTPVIGTVSNADNGLSYSDWLTVNVYEVVQVWLYYWEQRGAPLSDDQVEVIGYASAITNKSVGHFQGRYTFSQHEIIVINCYDVLPANMEVTRFMEHVSYPLLDGQQLWLDIASSDCKDKSGGNTGKAYYRYYYSDNSLN